ncbi:MAG: CRISPR-associated endonuclease Cas3'' [Candidatus Abyssobacteria bacterium SURF_5]|uniref:CRISPR-associated endonuclease Cas3 n=1 Tax=Abyssobacteria bacterium (strain SURF_5) TaxID=2093360 RepID=A0A3A4NU66_ABYX5|nr:MAG: CRISPR-associated endonuclease Cas3'' [Candidatus Abyssubacteria bacterium SURF_5]
MKSYQEKALAHSTEDGRFQLLAEHLQGTSKLSSHFAQNFGCADWAGLAGLWHDLGKYSEDFQRYIRGKPGKIDHSTYGAMKACEKFGLPGRLIAYLIAGHHAGLPDWQSEDSGLSGLAQRLENAKLRDIVNNLPENILTQKLPPEKPPAGADPSMWIRMLFSCLVDADFLDTEAFVNPEKFASREGYPELKELLPSFNAFMQRKTAKAEKTTVNTTRAEILRQCISKAFLEPHIFSMTVPTGGGKTLSSMAFALNHALEHGKRRIIYVIPFTSIIEQTADQFREIFGDAVLEHHSNIDFTEDGEPLRRNLAAENWDAPIIVTTTVQFFESLYASRPSRCRKLHNIVNSVVILDEAQVLPPDLLNPILKALAELYKNYGVTLLLTTATQPAFSPRQSIDFDFAGLPGIREIIENPDLLHARLKRVTVQIPEDLHQELAWEELARQLLEHPTVLCIVNRRDDCKRLYRQMPDGTIHLSALMCGAHRSKVIAEIKRQLQALIPIRVISTQLVEAGVDLDFPVVYRAIAGLDSIAQAAGRCNREGQLAWGSVKLFVPEGKAPAGYLRQAAEIGRRLLISTGEEDPLAPERFTKYFQELYWLRADRLDAKGILKDLMPDPQLRFSFRTAASKFQIIDEAQQATVLVRYVDGVRLIDLLRKKGPERWLMRKLQRYVVNIPRYKVNGLLKGGQIEELFPSIYVQSDIGHYDQVLGFCPESQPFEPDDLIV